MKDYNKDISRYHIYCDESRQNKEQYMILGGLIIDKIHINYIQDQLILFRKNNKFFGEFKWTKVSRAKLDVYKQFINHFFSLNNDKNLHFRCLIINNHKVNHKKYSNGDKEVGFYKFYYQLIVNSFIRINNPTGTKAYFYIYLDQFNSNQTLDYFKDKINSGTLIRYKLRLNHTPCKDISFIDSKKSDLIQFNDVLLGAVGWHKNDMDTRQNCSPAKKELAEYIAKRIGVYRLGTSMNRNDFKTWNFTLS